MAYAPYYVEWKNLPDTSTPIRAEALENMEDGIATAQATAEAAATEAAGKPSIGLLIALGG